jgi:hypothetical protein
MSLTNWWLRIGIGRALAPYLYFAAGGAVLGLGVLGLYELTHWLLRLGGEANATPLYTFGVLVGAVVGLAVFVGLARPYLALLIRTVGLRYWVTPGIQPQFQLRNQQRSLFDSEPRQPSQFSEFSLPLDLTAESYVERAKHGPARSHNQLYMSRFLLRLVGALVNTELVIPDDCAGEPWEAFLALRGRGARFEQTRYRFRRTSDPTDLRSTRSDLFARAGEPFANGPMIVHTVFSGREDATVFRDAWLRVILNQEQYFAYQAENAVSAGSGPLTLMPRSLRSAIAGPITRISSSPR